MLIDKSDLMQFNFCIFTVHSLVKKDSSPANYYFVVVQISSALSHWFPFPKYGCLVHSNVVRLFRVYTRHNFQS